MFVFFDSPLFLFDRLSYLFVTTIYHRLSCQTIRVYDRFFLVHVKITYFFTFLSKTVHLSIHICLQAFFFLHSDINNISQINKPTAAQTGAISDPGAVYTIFTSLHRTHFQRPAAPCFQYHPDKPSMKDHTVLKKTLFSYQYPRAV